MNIETYHIPFFNADSCSADCLVAFVDFAWLFDATSQSQAGEIPKPSWLAHILNVTPSLSASCSESKHLLISEVPNLKASRLLLVNTNKLNSIANCTPDEAHKIRNMLARQATFICSQLDE